MINLHCHSVYSVLDGLLSVEEISDIGKENGAIALTDHGTFAGHSLFYKSCTEKKVKPILGVEAYVKHGSLPERYHITILAKNNDGYKALLKLHTEAAFKMTKYPIIDASSISQNSNNLIVLTGCSSGYLISEGHSQNKAMDNLNELASMFSNIYVEFQPNDEYKENYEAVYYATQKLGIPTVITTDIHYLTKEDYGTYRNLHKILMKKDSPLKLDWLYVWEEQELYNYFTNNGYSGKFVVDSFKNADEIASSCNVVLSYDRKWDFPVNRKEIWDKCVERIFNLHLNNNPTYLKRLSYEFAIFDSLNLLGYLNFCSGILDYCKQNNIPYGPGRGSCVGSLVCYLLGITEIDPIVNELSFERFLSPKSTVGLYNKGVTNEL